uniref:Polysacc_synt_4 domain-containing protein n=1 Tax=Macrostomum lignano TaxID=282301 RepID=A0A1I8FG72_9PLAT
MVDPNAENYVNDAPGCTRPVGTRPPTGICSADVRRPSQAAPHSARRRHLRAEFRARFPCLAVGKLVESELKSEDSKSAWRQFCQLFEDTVGEYNFGTLLRLDSAGDYSEANTTLVPRIQFLAVEVARNREGFNRGLDSLVPSQSALGAEPGCQELGTRRDLPFAEELCLLHLLLLDTFVL